MNERLLDNQCLDETAGVSETMKTTVCKLLTPQSQESQLFPKDIE